MLRHGGFPHCNSVSQNPISHALLFPNKPHLYFASNQVTPSKLASFHGRIRTGLCVFASKIPGKDRNILLEREKVVDDNEYGDEEEEFGEDEEIEDDEDEIIVPLKYMKEWSKNRPPGFGEGRVYNTSIEDKLVEEIEQSRLAQAANLNKLKNSPQTPNSKKDSLQNQKASPSGFRVRLTNLPKKKNIDRDLRAAFKGYPGILNIIPAVSGNKKTREPVCKGLAFVDFKSQNEANRFVELFSGESIPFGKIQKQINCEIINLSSPKTSDKQAVDKINLPPPAADPRLEGDLNPVFETHAEGAIDDNVSKTRLYTGILENFTSLDSIDVNSQEQEKEPATDAEPPKSQNKIGAKGKKIGAKRKGEKAPTPKIPGSANRFVELFSGESIPFGKIQKQINSEIINSSSPKTSDKQAVDKINLPPPAADPRLEGDLNPVFETHAEGAIDDNVSKTRLYTGILENFTSLDSIGVNSQEQEKEPATDAEPPKSQKKIGAKGKKSGAKRKGEKAPKLKIPGSANRLKIRDKTLLSGVFSKYGVKPDLPAKEDS